jgi:hypothetical protein
MKIGAQELKLLLCLALVLGSGSRAFSGSASPATSTEIINYSTGDSPLSDGVVITGLGKAFSTRVSADSWPALVQKLKPTFAWNGCDMMWIERDISAQPKFILDEAYIYQPTNQSRRWILVKDDRTESWSALWSREDWWRQFGNYNLRADIPLQKTIPDAADNGDRGNYAVIKSANERLGTVYEIGWQREISPGNGLADYGRRIYVWEDRSNHWHFLGEGPEEGSAKGGYNTVELQVLWNATSTNKPPLQIRFHCEDVTTPYNVDADDTNPPPDVTIYSDCMLAGRFPAKCQPVGTNPYLLAGKDDTLKKIISRLNYYWPGWHDWPVEAERQAMNKRARAAWRAVIVRLNPNLPQRRIIKEGTRVDIMNPGEFENHQIEVERQMRAANKSESK